MCWGEGAGWQGVWAVGMFWSSGSSLGSLLRVSRTYLGITQRPVFAVPSGVCGRLAFAKLFLIFFCTNIFSAHFFLSQAYSIIVRVISSSSSLLCVCFTPCQQLKLQYPALYLCSYSLNYLLSCAHALPNWMAGCFVRKVFLSRRDFALGEREGVGGKLDYLEYRLPALRIVVAFRKCSETRFEPRDSQCMGDKRAFYPLHCRTAGWLPLAFLLSG